MPHRGQKPSPTCATPRRVLARASLRPRVSFALRLLRNPVVGPLEERRRPRVEAAGARLGVPRGQPPVGALPTKALAAQAEVDLSTAGLSLSPLPPVAARDLIWSQHRQEPRGPS